MTDKQIASLAAHGIAAQFAVASLLRQMTLKGMISEVERISILEQALVPLEKYHSPVESTVDLVDEVRRQLENLY